MINIRVFGADWCPDCKRAKSFLDQNNINYEFIDIDLDEKAVKKVEQINSGKRIIPTIEVNQLAYANPDNLKLSQILGINQAGRVILYGADWCPDCKRAKNFLQSSNINFQFIDIDQHQWASSVVEQINNGKRIIPTILIDDKPYTNPDNSKLSELLKINLSKETKLYDVAIIGGGAAGLTTSIYCQRDKLDTIILEKKNIGGNAFLTEKIENYPGFTSISGPELMDKMHSQATTYGAKINEGTEVLSIKKKESYFNLETSLGEVKSKTIVLATGSTYRLLEIPGEQELIGAGIHFCATCDGAFYRDKDVIVIGGGNSALEEGIFLSGFCKNVTIVNRKSEFSASKVYIDKLPSIKNIKTLMNKTSLEFIANEKGLFSSLKVIDNESKEESLVEADGAFVFIGLIPNTNFVKDLVELSEEGFINTACAQSQTNVSGIFAAGDCRQGAIAQVASATGEGVLASYAIRRYLSS